MYSSSASFWSEQLAGPCHLNIFCTSDLADPGFAVYSKLGEAHLRAPCEAMLRARKTSSQRARFVQQPAGNTAHIAVDI